MRKPTFRCDPAGQALYTSRQRRPVELRVVQYGVTRGRLAEIVDEGDGWDVLHLSGHGGRGQFLLEAVDGSPDPVDTGELVGAGRLAS